MNLKRFFRVLLLILTVMLALMPAAVQAVQKTGWVKSQKRYYYYNKTGKKVQGLRTIEGKKYYFDEEGKQLTGWQKIGSRHYFFRLANGKNGYMETDCTVNGVRLYKSGKASTKGNKKRLQVLTTASTIVNTVTNPAMKKKQKMKEVWNFLQTHFEYTIDTMHFYEAEDWEVNYALAMFRNRKGNCYGMAAAWAFLANACGCTTVNVVSSTAHGWVEIAGKIYDPSWERVDPENIYYGRSYKDSGKNGSPTYAQGRIFVKKV